MSRKIVIDNQKGGVGKTALTTGLASAIAEAGGRVLIVDLDPQGNATAGVGGRRPSSGHLRVMDDLMRQVSATHMIGTDLDPVPSAEPDGTGLETSWPSAARTTKACAVCAQESGVSTPAHFPEMFCVGRACLLIVEVVDHFRELPVAVERGESHKQVADVALVPMGKRGDLGGDPSRLDERLGIGLRAGVLGRTGGDCRLPHVGGGITHDEAEHGDVFESLVGAHTPSNADEIRKCGDSGRPGGAFRNECGPLLREEFDV